MVLDAVDIDLDLVADVELGLLAGGSEFAQRHAPFGFEADVDDGHVVFDAGDGAFDDLAFKAFVFAAEMFVEERREIVAGGICRSGHKKSVLLVLLPASGCLRWSFDPTAAAAPCRPRLSRRVGAYAEAQALTLTASRSFPLPRRGEGGGTKQKARQRPATPPLTRCLVLASASASARWTGRHIGEGRVRPQVVLAAERRGKARGGFCCKPTVCT